MRAVIWRCVSCRRRDVPTNAVGRLRPHHPVENVTLYPIGERCAGSGLPPVDRLVDTIEGHAALAP